MNRQPSPEHESAPKASGKPRERFAAFHGFVEAIRRVPSAFRRPETLMLAMAIFASFGVHMPPYLGLGSLAEYFREQEKEEKESEPVEVSYEFSDPTPPEAEAQAEPEQAPAEDAPPPEAKRPKAPPEPKPKRAPEPEPKKVSKVEVAEPTPPPPPPPKQQRKQSISQKSDDPDVEPPPDARYLAEEARRVEEETVASVRDLVHDDPDPRAAAPEDRGVDEAGDDAEDHETMSASGQQEEVPEKVAPVKPPEPPAGGPDRPSRPGREAQSEQREVAASTPAPGTVIKDPLGSFTLAAAEEPRERQQARRAQAGGSAGGGGKGQPNLRVTWRAFEDTYDEETLARERVPQRRTQQGSSSRKERWKEFRAALENYIVGVRPGNQTALNAAADPFAAYIAAFHRHLHQAFALHFLGSLPAVGELSDPALVTTVEIVINPDGSLHRVGVVKTSGQTLFDFGAFNAVKSGEPYPRPPSRIHSADGRVYLRWALHRDHSQCGTWNAEPYILSDPPDVVNDSMPMPPGMRGPSRPGPG